MRDYKTIGIRLSPQEAKSIELLARNSELTISELVRLWLEQAARQAWHERQAQERGE
jgi:hypothetical protein